MEDSNGSLRTIGLNRNIQDDDGYMDIEVKEGKTPTIDGTNVSTFTTETLQLADEKRLYILSKKQDYIPPELLAYFQQTGISSQGGRDGNKFSNEEV